MIPTRKWHRLLMGVAVAAALSLGSSASAQQWSERTVLTFSDPIMVPGATLRPGTYVFTLAQPNDSRHLVQIFREGDREPLVLAHAVPIKRNEGRGDTMLTFNPTDRGVPALKAWYYAHSSYGHEFIYPENEARQIAERSKSIVLSADVEDTEDEQGTLRLYHPEGAHTEWRADAATQSEWQEWQAQNRGVVRMQSGGDAEDDDAESRAPMMITDAPASRVDLDDVESEPFKYVGRTISVDAEVEEIYGPRLFTIDEPHWGDLDGEVLVFAPSMLAALVNNNDRVTITGTVQRAAMAEIEREWGWFELDPEIEVDFLERPVLVATRIVGGDDNRALYISIDEAAPTTGGATTAAGAGTIVDPGAVGSGTTDLVGRRVNLRNVRVLRPATGGGFFVDAPGGAVLVLPTPRLVKSVAPGDTVTLTGAIAALPDRTAERVNPPAGWNEQIYIVAMSVSK